MNDSPVRIPVVEVHERIARIQDFDHGYREGRSQGRWEDAYVGVALVCMLVLIVIGFAR